MCEFLVFFFEKFWKNLEFPTHIFPEITPKHIVKRQKIQHAPSARAWLFAGLWANEKLFVLKNFYPFIPKMEKMFFPNLGIFRASEKKKSFLCKNAFKMAFLVASLGSSPRVIMQWKPDLERLASRPFTITDACGDHRWPPVTWPGH